MQREDNGIDIQVSFKGKVSDKNTNVMIVGEVVKTYIPLKKKDVKNYEAKGVKYIREDTELVLIGISYDKKGNPSLAKLSFSPIIS